MIRMDKFAISKRPYAVALDTFEATWREYTWTGEPPPGASKGSWDCAIQAVWFRRRSGVTVACIGRLWDIKKEKPQDALELLANLGTKVYGGDAQGRWNGESYWGTGSLETQQEHLAILRPMLANYPEIPPGYSGWWRF